MTFYGSWPFDALLLEACQPYYRYQVPHEQAQKARRCSPPSSTPQQQHAPRFHASEADDAYKLYIALPGLEHKDIAININEGRVLSLEVNRPADHALDAFRTIPSKLRRTWKMPEAVDAIGICARLANGELVITLPKAAKVEPQRVLIAGDEDAKPLAPAPVSAPQPAAPTEANIAAAAKAMDTAPVHGSSGNRGSNGGSAGKPAEVRSEEDGSVEDLSDEERKAERAARRTRALATEAGPVLMDADEAPAVAA